MNSLVQIAPPVGEPISVADMMLQLGMGTVTDATLNSVLSGQLLSFIAAARHFCETYTRSVYLTQTWLYKRDGFIRHHYEYEGHWENRGFLLPKVPFQSLEWFKYVDVSGVLQTLMQDTSYGTNPANPIYGFQLDPGSETQPARFDPPWARPWPPTRLVQGNVMLQFRCGFGGPITASMTIDSSVLAGPTFLPGDVGQSVIVPGAGASGTALLTTVQSVGVNGQATLADSASATVAAAIGYAGRPVPPPILQAIKFMTQFFYEQGSVVDVPVPRVVMALLDPYRNLVA